MRGMTVGTCGSALLAVLLAMPLGAQSAPAPGPEHGKLAAFVGEWSMSGRAEATAWGAAGPVEGTMRCEWFAGNFHVICDSKQKGPSGDEKWHMVMTYDPAAGHYVSYGIGSMGFTATETGRLEGDTWTFEGAQETAGTSVRWRSHMRMVGTDRMVWSGEFSNDGKTWASTGAGTATRTR